MLLPIPRHTANRISLANHLALVVCRKGEGNPHLANELVRAVYMSYYLTRAGVGALSVEKYIRAEGALEKTIRSGNPEGAWQVDAEGAGALEEILTTYDEQLSSAPAWIVIDATDRLERFVEANKHSPIESR